MKYKKLLLITLSSVSLVTYAQECNNQSIIDLAKKGIGDAIIIAKIQNEKCTFETATSDILLLKENNISDEIVAAMISKKNEPVEPVENEKNVIVFNKIEEKGNSLVINNTNELKKGTRIQIYLPATGKDFMFVNKKKSKFSMGMLSGAADIIGTGATAVALGSNNLGTVLGAVDVAHKASAVQYGVDALDKIDKLDISKEAKKIAGKQAEILDWKYTDEGYILTVLIEKKKYEVNLQEALLMQEIKL